MLRLTEFSVASALSAPVPIPEGHAIFIRRLRGTGPWFENIDRDDIVGDFADNANGHWPRGRGDFCHFQPRVVQFQTVAAPFPAGAIGRVEGVKRRRRPEGTSCAPPSRTPDWRNGVGRLVLGIVKKEALVLYDAQLGDCFHFHSCPHVVDQLTRIVSPWIFDEAERPAGR